MYKTIERHHNAVKLVFTLWFIFAASIATACAQSVQEKQASKADIEADASAKVGKNILFDGSKSIIPDNMSKANFVWNFGDGNSEEGPEVMHSYKKTGKYKVTLTIKDKKEILADEQDIFVYHKSILLLTDITEKKSQIDNLINFAQGEGVELNVVGSYDSASEFISEEALTKKLSENLNALSQSDEIMIWTGDNVGLNALTRFLEENNGLKPPDIADKMLYIINNDTGNIQLNQSLSTLNPKQIIIAKESAVYVIVSTPGDNILKVLQQGGYEFKVIDESSRRLNIWNFMTYFVNYLSENGIPENTIVLILMLPIIATVIVFLRQVIGLNTYGLYTPIIICLTLLILGLKFGLLTLLTALVIGMSTRYVLKNINLLFMPKLAIVVIMITLSLFALLIAGIALKLLNSQFISLAIFPMLILGSLTEKFTSIQTEAGFLKTLWLTLQTVFSAIIAYIVVGGAIDFANFSFSWDFLRSFMRHYPESIFLFLLMNIGLGKWTGLKLVEYIRFREIFHHNEEE